MEAQMNFYLTIALVFALYAIIGYAVPKLGDGNTRFFWLLVFAFFTGIILITMLKEVVFVGLAILVGFILGALFSMWRLKALKRAGSIITDSK